MSKFFVSLLAVSLLCLTGCFSSDKGILNPVGPETSISGSPALIDINQQKETLDETTATCSVTMKIDGIVPNTEVVPNTTDTVSSTSVTISLTGIVPNAEEPNKDTTTVVPTKTDNEPGYATSVTFRIILPPN